MNDETITQPPLCGFQWPDGWGEHECHLVEGHTCRHRCECDFEAPLGGWPPPPPPEQP